MQPRIIVLIIDCRDILTIKNELLVYVSDQLGAIPTLKNKQFTLSAFDDDEIIDAGNAISAIKEFLDSIGENNNFAVISNKEIISITSISGKIIERDAPTSQLEMFSCTHCGFVTKYQVELTTHMRIHYL